MTDAEIIEVVTAHKEGKQIEYRYCSGDGWSNWFEMLPTHIGWDFRRNDYRVKPEPRKPREWVLAVVKTDAGCCIADADQIRARDVSEIETVRVREVIEE